MGHGLHRLEVLLVGLVMLLAGAVVVALLSVRPLSPSAPSIPQPMATLLVVPSRTPMVGDDHARAGLSHNLGAWTLWLGLRGLWPVLLLVVGLGGLVWMGMRRRRSRLPYTNQNLTRLLAAADPMTRAANVRVMQDLAAQGLLPRELAAAAGIVQDTRRARWWPHRPLLPRLSLPKRLPSLPRLPRSLGISSSLYRLVCRPTPLHEPAPACVLPPIADPVAPWTAEDRVLAVAALLATHGSDRDLGYSQAVLALDTSCKAGAHPVSVTLNPVLADEAPPVVLPAALSAAGWRVRWWSSTALVVNVPATLAASTRTPPLVPLLNHGLRQRTTRFVPLATWRHLGLYGGQALPALHAALGSLLYTQSPTALALTILDQGEITPLYRAVAHLVPPPAHAAALLDDLLQRVRRPPAPAIVRPLLLVVVEPDALALGVLTTLLTRLHDHPQVPLHLWVVQEQLHPTGHELYARLPALITSGGRGASALLPDARPWPRPSEARLIRRTLHATGRPLALDEVQAAAQFAQIHGTADGLPPVLWEGTNPLSLDLVASPLLREESPSGAAAPPLSRRAVLLQATIAAGDGAPGLPPRVPPPSERDVGSDMIRGDSAGPMPEPPPRAEPANGWPHGPPPLDGVALAALLTRIVSTPSIIAGQANECGVSKNRLVEVLKITHQAHAKEVAAWLMVWFDHAGLLVEPTTPSRLRHPRALTTVHLGEIAEKLTATPLPTKAQVQLAWADAHEPRS